MRSSARRRVVVGAAALAVLGALAGGVGALRASAGETDQCSLPLAQRSGGWMCPGPAGSPGEGR